MQKKWQVISPKVVVEKEDGYGRRIIITIILFFLIIALFSAGYFTGRHELVPLRHANLDLRREILSLSKELKILDEQNESLEQQIAALELTQRINQDALRVAQEDHKQLQDANLELEKDLSSLKRLVRKGRGGYLKIQNFSLKQGQSPDLINYNFTVAQMIDDFSESSGEIIIRILGMLHGKQVSLRLDEMSAAEPLIQNMRFKHFQNIKGSLRLPEDMVPEAVEVEVVPSAKSLMPLREKFNWLIDN